MSANVCCKAAWLIPLALTGCLATGPTNPSFPLTPEQAQVALEEMREHPRRLARPLLIVSNYMDSGRHAEGLRRVFHDCTGDSRIVTVVIGMPRSLAETRPQIINAVERAYPCSDPAWTAEVDVVGASLGGLAARYAASPLGMPGRRLRVARMFTIASPHGGAVIAKNYIGRSQQLWCDVRPDSELLAQLAATDGHARYELYPYARLHDTMVGERNAAPPGQIPIWVPSLPWKEGHDDAWEDPRLLADIARRLRGEAPFSGPDRAPLPE